MTGYSSRLGFGRDNDDRTTPTTVQATVVTTGNENPITGMNLWKLGVFGSEYSDGTGEVFPLVDQILPPTDADKTLMPNEDLTFDVTSE